MRKTEINRKFDAIVEFAGIPKFIDTPVKRYSSGMYVRLAFAVAAHMEPDILLLDEVLAVGDLAFQRKCLDHAKELQKRDATILFRVAQHVQHQDYVRAGHLSARRTESSTTDLSRVASSSTRRIAACRHSPGQA